MAQIVSSRDAKLEIEATINRNSTELVEQIKRIATNVRVGTTHFRLMLFSLLDKILFLRDGFKVAHQGQKGVEKKWEKYYQQQFFHIGYTWAYLSSLMPIRALMIDYPRLCYVNESMRWLVQHAGPLRTQIKSSIAEDAFWLKTFRAILSGGTVEIHPEKQSSDGYWKLETDHTEEEKAQATLARETEMGELSTVFEMSSIQSKSPDAKQIGRSASMPLPDKAVQHLPKNK